MLTEPFTIPFILIHHTEVVSPTTFSLIVYVFLHRGHLEATYKMFPGNDLFSGSHVPLCSNGPEIKTNGHKRRFRLIHCRQNLSQLDNHCVNMSPAKAEEGRSRERYWANICFTHFKWFSSIVCSFANKMWKSCIDQGDINTKAAIIERIWISLGCFKCIHGVLRYIIKCYYCLQMILKTFHMQENTFLPIINFNVYS